MAQSDREPLELPGDASLTQYGETPPGDGFRDRLRAEIGETELSMICGKVDAVAASLLVTRVITSWATVRTTTAGRLRDAGFTVVHSPTKTNRLHVSVYPPILDSGDYVEWGDELAKQFNECFSDPIVEGDQGE
jgi:hypothetical protein